MATAANVLVGAHSAFKIAAYVTSKGAGSLADVGFTKGGVTFDPKVELHQVEVDQRLGILAAIPKKREAELKVKLVEMTLENLRLALAQPTTNVTGTTPNYWISIDASSPAQYYQVQFIGPGVGTNFTRTATFWKCAVKEPGALMFKKDDEQGMDITFLVCEETTGTGTDSWGRFVDT